MIRVAISAFAHRGARGRSFVVYSALLAVALLALAAWIAPSARQADAEMLALYLRQPSPYNHPDLLPSLWTTLALADVFACWMLALAGFVVAPAMVAAAVAHERRAGTLDQLRTTPLSPLALAAGMIVGIPARLYLLCLGPLVLHFAAAIVGPLPLAACAQSLAVLLAGTAASCALGLCVALAPRQESGGTFAALGVAALLAVFGFVTGAFATDRHMVAWAWLHPSGAFDAVMLQPHGLWRRMAIGPWGGHFDNADYTRILPLVPMASVAASLTLAALLVGAACRKLGAPARPLFGKRQALVLFALTCASLVLPLWAADRWSSFDESAAYGFTMLLLPPLVVLGLFATPTFEAWALTARRGIRARWYGDDAAAHRAVWLMELFWALLAYALLHHRGYWFNRDESSALLWATWLALTLPIYFLFASTRYATVAARWAFGVAVAAHVVCQMIAIGLVRDRELHGFSGTFVTLAGIAGVAVPAWVAWRQRVLKVRTLAR